VLSKPENADIFSKSVLLNELIARRGVSWTRVFKDMETVMPANMRPLGIRLPQVGADDSDGINRVRLDVCRRDATGRCNQFAQESGKVQPIRISIRGESESAYTE
jgi:hypothetical protein